MIPCTNTLFQINKVLKFTGKPSIEEDIISIISELVETMLESVVVSKKIFKSFIS